MMRNMSDLMTRTIVSAIAGNPAQAPSRNVIPDAYRKVLEVLPDPIALIDRVGALLFENEPLRLITHGPAPDPCLMDDLTAMGRSLGVSQSSKGARWVDTMSSDGHYRLRAQTVDFTGADGSPLVLIVIQGTKPDALSDEYLAEVFGLTRKEARVARLLADGRSNRGVAAALCISPHTARHHTERILSKLGARSRAEVAARLRSPQRGRNVR